MKLVLLAIVTAMAALAQPRLEFEVAAIKPASPDAQGTRFSMQPGGALVISNATLKQIIMQAYQLREFQLEGGPNWAGSEQFDIRATNESFTTLEGLKQADLEGIRDRTLTRARNLLADRFGVVLRREMREQAVYALTVAKSGSKLKPTEFDVLKRSTSVRNGDGGRVQIKVLSLDMASFVRTLAGILERAVVDRTDLTGNYDFEVEWVQDLNKVDDGPSVFTAMQEQLGLRLEATRAPVEVYVIEKAEHPSEN
jgi:uncharacterized protein (TIGR03435 family)